MKRTLVLLALACGCLMGFAQSENSKSKTVQFQLRNEGRCAFDYYLLGQDFPLEYEVMVVTEMSSGEKMGCMQITTKRKRSRHSSGYTGTIDVDELDSCINMVQYLIGRVKETPESSFSKVEFVSRDKIRLGAYYKDKLWQIYIQTEDGSPNSYEYLDDANLTRLVEFINRAKAKIAEKAEK